MNKLSNTHQRFLQEALEEREKSLKEFAGFQQIAYDTLIAVHKVFEATGIDYFLAYGSLLGAIRDHGMIPWDYDIDIWVRGDDIERIIAALKQLPHNYYFVTRFNTKTDRHYFIRVAPKEYSSEILHVDVFLLWNGGDDIKKLAKKIRHLNIYRELAFWKNCDLRYLAAGKTRAIKKICRIKQRLHKPIPNCLLDIAYKYLINRLNLPGRYVTDEYEIFESKHFRETDTIELADGVQLRIPHNSEELLSKIYGDYTSYAPISKRVAEMDEQLKRLRQSAI